MNFSTLFRFILIIFLTSSCLNKIDVNLKNTAPKISNIKLENNQLVLYGSGLDAVKEVSLKSNSTSSVLTLSSISSDKITTNINSNLNIDISQVFELVVSSAKASTIYSISFSLCNSTLNSKAFDCSISPSNGQVLTYDSATSKWIPKTPLAATGVNYIGTYNASVNAAPSTSGINIGDYYIVNAAGSFGGDSYLVGDWIIFSSNSQWERVPNGLSTITSVFGRTGIVTGLKGDYSLNKMSDVDLSTTTPIIGDVLKYDGTNWVPGVVSSGGGGTITTVNGTAPITTSGTTSITVSIPAANNTTSGYLSSTDWNTFNNKQGSITPGTSSQYYRGDKTWQTLDTSIVPENGNLYFTNARVLGLGLSGYSIGANTALLASDTILSAFGKLQGQISSISSGSSDYLIKNSSDTVSGVVVVNGTGDLQVGTPINMTSAINKSYVSSYYLPLIGGTLSSDLILDTQAKFKGGSNYVTLKAGSALASNITLTLPISTGSSGQVLQTDGSGVLSWTTLSSSATPSGTAGGDLSGTYPNPSLKNGVITDSHIATTISESKITNLVSDLAGKISTTLNSAKILVGNSSNIATPVSLSGDATIDNTGTMTLSNSGVVAGTYNTVAVDSKGRVTTGSNTAVVTSLTINAPIVNSGTAIDPILSLPTANNTTSGYLSSTDWNTFNNKQSAISKSSTQDVSKLRIYGANTTNYVELSTATLTANRSFVFPDSNGSNGNVLSTDGSGNLSWIAIPSAPVTSVSGKTGVVTLSTSDVSEGSNLYFTNARGIGSLLTGYTTGSNTALSASDTILSGMQKLEGQISAKQGLITAGLTTQYYRGDKTWATLATDVLSTAITSPTLTNSTIATNDTIQTSLGKLQGQINNTVTTSSITGSNGIIDAFSGVMYHRTCSSNQFLAWNTVSGWTCTNPSGAVITGSTATSGYLPYFNTSTTLANSKFYYDGTSVGVGTASPKALFQIGNGTSSPFDGSAVPFYISQNGNTAMAIKNSSNGTEMGSGVYDDYGYLGTLSNSKFNLLANDTIYFEMWPSGYIGIGLYGATPTEKLHIDGNVKANSFLTTSDVRLKENIEISKGVNYLNKINGYTFTFKKDKSKTAGVLAQEVEKVFPDAVKTDKESGFKSVNYQFLIAPIINSIKDIFKQNNINSKEISELKKENLYLIQKNKEFETRLLLMSEKINKLEKLKQ